ncbi:MAG TPA: glycosyltransferase, partial [Candidatus Angelobacter sp.]|nr:glycosyltransferase [Candidatus Angelobacter sp.]
RLNKVKRKLRIAFCGTRGIPHSYGGAEEVIGELAPRLAARGHDVTVYCRRGLFRERPKWFRGVLLTYLPSIETKVLGTPTHTLLSMVDVLFRRTDVIVVWNLPSAPFCLVPRLFGKRVAIMVDGLDWRRDKWGTAGKAYLYWSARWAGRICPRGVITDTADMQRLYLEEFGTTTACIPCGAKTETSTNVEAVRRHGLKPFEYYLIASRLVPENNAHLIVQAFEQVRSKRLLAIAGEANYRSKFVERLKQTKDPRVRFLGHVADREQMKELHCNAYAYVHGHSMRGTNPSLLKALGCGNCVLALNTPSNAEVLGSYGILFERDADDLAFKLTYVEHHPEVAREYRRRAPERIREAYSWETITEQYEEFFLRLAAGKDPTRSRSRVTESEGALLPAGAKERD